MRYGAFIHAGHLFGIAKEAYERTKDAPSEFEFGQHDATVAMVFSAAALEAFINEVGGLAGQPTIPIPGIPQNPASVLELFRILDEAEKSLEKVQEKFLKAKRVLIGQEYEKGSAPYQDFDLLISLRNEIVHFKFESVEFGPMMEGLSEPPILRRLQSKGILAKLAQEGASSWITKVETRAAARWACNAAAKMVQSLLEIIAKCHFKRGLVIFYERIFQPVV